MSGQLQIAAHVGMYMLLGFGLVICWHAIVPPLRAHWARQRRYGRWLYWDNRPYERSWPRQVRKGWLAAHDEELADRMHAAVTAGHAETVSQLVQTALKRAAAQ